MSNIEIHFEGPDGSAYTVCMDDAWTRTLSSDGGELIDLAVARLKAAACITSQ